jgi:hypothetical protein
MRTSLLTSTAPRIENGLLKVTTALLDLVLITHLLLTLNTSPTFHAPCLGAT